MNKRTLYGVVGGLLIGILWFVGFLFVLMSPVLINSGGISATYAPRKESTKYVTVTPRPTRTPRPTKAPEYGTMDNPIEFGGRAYLIWDNVSDFDVSIASVVRGLEALDIVMSENQFNEVPADGMEYIVFVARIRHTGDDIEILEFTDFNWGVLSNGRIFDWSLAVCCFEGVKLARGGVADQTVAMQVYVADENPLLVFDEKFYFKTK